MAETGGTGRLIGFRALFAGLALAILFFRLLPLQALPPGWAPPDLIVALAFAWVLRRPDYVPALLLGAVMCLADLLLQRPPGLWAALVVLGAEALRARAGDLREVGFLFEWLTVALVLAAITLAYRLALTATGVGQAPLGLTAVQLVSTLAIYPVVVLISHLMLGVRKAATGEIDERGRRL
jgi:rod shape-determining protein MreD